MTVPTGADPGSARPVWPDVSALVKPRWHGRGRRLGLLARSGSSSTGPPCRQPTLTCARGRSLVIPSWPFEEYESGVQLVILRTARYNHDSGEVDFGEISIFVGPNFVITVRQGVASELHGARTRLEQHPKLLALGTNSVLWAILDQVIKGYGPVVADLESDIEQVEGTVFSGAVAPTERIYDLRREVSDFYRAVHPLLAVLTGVERNVGNAELRPYLRDVHDHVHLISEEVAAQKDLLATVLQANMAVISVEQTRVS